MKKKIYNWLNNIWIGICKIYIQMVNEKALGTYIIVTAVLSSEVWVPYLIGIITWGTDLSKWMFGVGSACWAFWLGPFTPFIPLTIAITLGIVKIRSKIHSRRIKKNEQISQ